MDRKVKREDRKLKFETLQLHAGQEQADIATDARAVPIYQTSSYVFHSSAHAAERFSLEDTGNIYGRLTNPTADIFEKRVAALEGGTAALAVASGAAAITYTFENLAQQGDHFVSAKNIYGGTYNLLAHTLPQYGIHTSFVDIFNLNEVETAIRENTKAIFIETLGNPNSDVADIEAIAKIAHRHQIPLVVDNTFATPYLVRPFEYGADIVVHSATKFIGGHGTTLGGVIVESGKFDWEGSGKFATLTEPNPSYHGISFTKAAKGAAFVTKIRAVLLRDTGACISPFHAFLLLQGLETLSLRVERHVENALKVVKFLENHPQVERVHHPSVSTDKIQRTLYTKYLPKGGGSIFTFDIKGDKEKAQAFIDNLEVFSLLANVADAKSLVIHPATTTHSQCTAEELEEQGIQENTIRLSIGTENIDDIIQDLEEAFKAVENKE
ncbi:MAG: O-acetylhomoserine aminocarboxypropyltransferase/cysteine synthase [Clostridiales bacterium]|nr:O-acetylhomoserine aminocarboxypropyltransferase/cysteine synthase [Clostridiales bacterium]